MVQVAYIEEDVNGWKAIIIINKKRAVLSKTKRKEPLVRFLAQQGYRIIDTSEGEEA